LEKNADRRPDMARMKRIELGKEWKELIEADE
jgi:hypothetical protein